jgi:YD repeat-containing protein
LISIRNADGQLVQVIDGRGIETRYEYDDAGRETAKIAAFGLPQQRRTETDYDAKGQSHEPPG